jgi:DNA mismatch repair protein MutS
MSKPTSGIEELTPLMRQYNELKAKVPDALLFFRMGDFYELFGDDAVEASKILEITLTSRDKNKENPMPMAGVPWHSSQGYIQRLLKAGKKVAIGEQLEDDPDAEEVLTKTGKKAPKIVRRDIVRQFTPGVQFDLEGSEANFLAVIVALGTSATSRSTSLGGFSKNSSGVGNTSKNSSASSTKNGSEKGSWILACLDASTGECLVSEALSSDKLAQDLGSLPIRHLLRSHESLATGSENEDALKSAISSLSGAGALIETLPSNYLSLDQAENLLRNHYEIKSLETFLSTNEAVLAVGALVMYALRTQQQEKLSHLRIPAPLHRAQSMILGPRTPQHLDLLPSPDGTPNLYTLINRTRSALGARQLRRWILAPLKSPIEIQERQFAVKELAHGLSLGARGAEALSSSMGEVYDLERILGRINTRLAGPRDSLALGKSLGVIHLLQQKLADSAATAQAGSALNSNSPSNSNGPSKTLLEISTSLKRLHSELAPLSERILTTQKAEAPFVARDGGIFNIGTQPELDRLININEDGQKWLIDLETREREATGISSLKVRYNRVFGYYIEITQSHLKNVPPHYQRKQTTVGSERFFTEELKKFEDEIITAVSRQKSLEQELFEELLDAIRSKTSFIMEYAKILGELDSLISLARLSQDSGWVFPEIDDSKDLMLNQGRHPLVDFTSRGTFVPNDLELSPTTRRTLMITGPNMGGKSTIMRQTALIVLLGQMGAPVPAQSARWGSVSSLYTRIGAHDAIARGQSTFMVEMSELAHILHHADDRSLIILDEIGRGTSTYDGVSVAWATLEWICTQIQARTLFATHYHELTRLSGSIPLLANAHMAVESGAEVGQNGLKSGTQNAEFRFLYILKEGAANESFGIHVAKLAGLPKAVVDRAWKVLDELEATAIASNNSTLTPDTQQLSFFAPGPQLAAVPAEPHPVLTEIEKLNPNEMTPMQALTTLAKLQEMSRESDSAFSSKQSR